MKIQLTFLSDWQHPIHPSEGLYQTEAFYRKEGRSSLLLTEEKKGLFSAGRFLSCNCLFLGGEVEGGGGGPGDRFFIGVEQKIPA